MAENVAACEAADRATTAMSKSQEWPAITDSSVLV